MPRFSLPSEAKTRKAERNEQNPATTPSLYAHPRTRGKPPPGSRKPASRAGFLFPGLLIGRDVRDTRLSE